MGPQLMMHQTIIFMSHRGHGHVESNVLVQVQIPLKMLTNRNYYKINAEKNKIVISVCASNGQAKQTLH